MLFRSICRHFRSSDKVLKKFKINPHIVELLPADREATAALLNAVGYVDLIIPRGSSSLIHFVRENARIPVIETGAGICHTYFDEFGDTNKGADIIHNAKTKGENIKANIRARFINDSYDSEVRSIETDGRTFERYCRRYTQCSNTPLSFG